MLNKMRLLIIWLIIFIAASLRSQEILWELNLPEQHMEISNWLNENNYKISRFPNSKWIINKEELLMYSEDESYEIKIRFPKIILAFKNPVIEFEYIPLDLPEKANLRYGKLEDAAFRIYLGFDKYNWCRAPNSVVYAHGNSNKEGNVFKSGRLCLSNIHFVIVGDGKKEKRVAVKRNIYEDYRSIFGSRDTPGLIGIMIKTDSNNSNGRSKVKLKKIRILAY